LLCTKSLECGKVGSPLRIGSGGLVHEVFVATASALRFLDGVWVFTKKI
jgi:hypothetical protein